MGQTETQTAFYWADSMADLESFWPEVVPHAFWLDGQYTPSPMGMSYGYDADLATGEIWSRYFKGKYTGEDGAAFDFGFTYNARYTWPDWYSVDLTGQEYQEQYETKDGAVVSIEIIPSVTGKSVFYTAISTEHTICTLHGTQMELERSGTFWTTWSCPSCSPTSRNQPNRRKNRPPGTPGGLL